jgi:alpha-1,6-mannosyltransferase
VHLVDISMFYPAQTGGVSTYLHAKSRWLKLHSPMQHSVVAPVMGSKCEADVISVPSVPIPCSNGFRWPVSTALATRCLVRLAPQIIEAGDPYQFAWSALQAKKKLDISALAFYHSDLPQLAGQRFGKAAQQAANLYVGMLYRQFDLVLAPSRVMVNKLRKLGVMQALHQPLGVDTRVFSPVRKKHLLRSCLGLSENTRLLIYAGRFTREKNLPQLIQAVEDLGAPYHLLLVGRGSLLRQSSAVTCLPFQADPRELAALIAACDLFVHPGQHETFGLVVLEALACGVPVLGVDGGGVAELLDEQTGMLVPPGSRAALAEGIRALFRTDLRVLGRNGRRKMQMHYDWNCIMPQLMGHYAMLAGVRWHTVCGSEPLRSP